MRIALPHHNRIRHAMVGFHGSWHDSRAFSQSTICKEPGLHFSKDEFVSGDSAYACTPTCIPVYKKPRNGTLSEKSEFFNYRISSGRVYSEHGYGMLKGKFPSLRDLRIMITCDKDHAFACHWIEACLILHNLCIDDDFHDEAWLLYGRDDEDEGQGRAQAAGPDVGSGFAKRDTLRDELWAKDH